MTRRRESGNFAAVLVAIVLFAATGRHLTHIGRSHEDEMGEAEALNDRP